MASYEGEPIFLQAEALGCYGRAADQPGEEEQCHRVEDESGADQREADRDARNAQDQDPPAADPIGNLSEQRRGEQHASS